MDTSTLNAKGGRETSSGSARRQVAALTRGVLPTGVAESGIERARHGVVRSLPFGMPLHREQKARFGTLRGAVGGLVDVGLDQTVGGVGLSQKIGR